MKLKILAVVALGAVGVGAAVYAIGGIAAERGRDDPVPDQRRRRPATSPTTSPRPARSRRSAAYGARVRGGPVPRRRRRDRAELDDDLAGDRGQGRGRRHGQEGRRPRDGRHGRPQARSSRTAENDLDVRAGRACAPRKTTLSDAEDADVTAADPPGQDRPLQRREPGREREADASTTSRPRSTPRRSPPRSTASSPTVNIVTGLRCPVGRRDRHRLAPTFQVTADVVESDLADVRSARRRRSRSPRSTPTSTGTVTAIAPTASSDSGSGVVSYPVTVSLTDAPATVRAGMSADVTITIDSATNVLTVPAAALRGHAGDYSVLVLGADGTPTAAGRSRSGSSRTRRPRSRAA